MPRLNQLKFTCSHFFISITHSPDVRSHYKYSLCFGQLGILVSLPIPKVYCYIHQTPTKRIRPQAEVYVAAEKACHVNTCKSMGLGRLMVNDVANEDRSSVSNRTRTALGALIRRLPDQTSNNRTLGTHRIYYNGNKNSKHTHTHANKHTLRFA